MLLLKLISPKKLPRKKTDWKFCHKFYKVMLKLYLRLYSKGVIEDYIVVNDVTVLHTLRDVWFENELQRFDIKLKPTLVAAKKQALQTRKHHRYRTFNWEDKTTVLHLGSSCSITHNKRTSFDTDMSGQLQTSSNNDRILSIRFTESRKGRTPIEKKPTERTEPREESEVPPTPVSQPKKKKIHIKDTIKHRQETSHVEETEKATPQDSFTKHAGFEENDIF